MKENPLRKLLALGQSIWLDYIRRDLISSGKLCRLIEQDGLCGITSNPAIFENSITGSHDYEEDIRALALQGRSALAIYEALSQRDVQRAADEFMPVYDTTDAADGYVSLEVNPHLAHDTLGTIEEARRLWAVVDRPNVMIKVPATTEGLAAIQQLTSEGINVNVTLLFGLPRYRQVADAYLSGLESRAARHQPLQRVASVASAKGAYQIYREIFGSERFRALADMKGRAQRLLWASTATKNPDYEDIRYVEGLIGAETVTTVPMETLDAYRDHGQPKLRIEDDVELAQLSLAQLSRLGISIDSVTQRLVDEGIDKFTAPFDELLATIEVMGHPGRKAVIS